MYNFQAFHQADRIQFGVIAIGCIYISICIKKTKVDHVVFVYINTLNTTLLAPWLNQKVRSTAGSAGINSTSVVAIGEIG